MASNIINLAYLASAICFILAIRGLASPESARTGNAIGILGMTIAIGATLFAPQITTFVMVLGGIAIGGAIGMFVALRVKITELPQLVAVFNSLVGLAAVFIAGAALHSPELYGIPSGDNLPTSSLVEMMLSAAIGSVTFTGSIIAFAKLHGLMTGTPVAWAASNTLLEYGSTKVS